MSGQAPLARPQQGDHGVELQRVAADDDAMGSPQNRASLPDWSNMRPTHAKVVETTGTIRNSNCQAADTVSAPRPTDVWPLARRA